MKPRILLPLFLAFAALAAAQNPFQWTGHLSPAKTLEVRGISGWIHAGPGSSDVLEITANKHGNRSDPNQVRVEVVESPDGITVCAVYPTPAGESPNECKPGGGHMSTRDNDVHVDFTLKVPAGVRLLAKNVNGSIEVNGLQGDAELATVNGGVTGSTTGSLHAKTVNGSIHVSMADGNWSGARDFETVNGTIEVELPAQVNTELSVATVNGSIQSDFAVATHSLSRRHLKGVIGSGGRQLNLKTVNGDVRVKRV